MACFNPDGLPPEPTRVWSRVQGRCATEEIESNNPIVFFPPTQEFLPISEVANRYGMLNKGNVLQYKKNSSNLTMKTRYSLIAKGQWVNTTKTFASQNVLQSIPNTKNLKRVNFNTIYADNGAPANLPVTCPEPTIPSIPKQLPTNPNIPAPIETIEFLSSATEESNPAFTNTEEDPFYPKDCPQYVDPRTLIPKKKKKPIPKKKKPRLIPKKKIEDLPKIKDPEEEEERQVIPDGGFLVCAVNDICGDIKVAGTQQFSKPNFCNPTTSSDVPGPIQELCYNDRVNRPFIPRNRYTMSNSGTKFPTGYKFPNQNN